MERWQYSRVFQWNRFYYMKCEFFSLSLSESTLYGLMSVAIETRNKWREENAKYEAKKYAIQQFDLLKKCITHWNLWQSNSNTNTHTKEGIGSPCTAERQQKHQKNIITIESIASCTQLSDFDRILWFTEFCCRREEKKRLEGLIFPPLNHSLFFFYLPPWRRLHRHFIMHDGYKWCASFFYSSEIGK